MGRAHHAHPAQSTVVPIDKQPATKLTVEAPFPGPLAQNVVYIPYRVENSQHHAIGWIGVTLFVAARRTLAHHRRRPAVAVGGLGPGAACGPDGAGEQRSARSWT